MEQRKGTLLKAYLDKCSFFYTTPLHAGDRAYIIQKDSLDSATITKLVSLGVHTFTSVNNRGLQHIMIEY